MPMTFICLKLFPTLGGSCWKGRQKWSKINLTGPPWSWYPELGWKTINEAETMERLWCRFLVIKNGWPSFRSLVRSLRQKLLIMLLRRHKHQANTSQDKDILISILAQSSLGVQTSSIMTSILQLSPSAPHASSIMVLTSSSPSEKSSFVLASSAPMMTSSFASVVVISSTKFNQVSLKSATIPSPSSSVTGKKWALPVCGLAFC